MQNTGTIEIEKMIDLLRQLKNLLRLICDLEKMECFTCWTI